MFSTRVIVSPFAHIFDIISLFAAELEEPKIGISIKGLSSTMFHASLLESDHGFRSDQLTTINPLPDYETLDWSKLKQIVDNILTLSHTSPGFHVSAVQVF